MKKILVPTDFSVNSKSGIRFAVNWANQKKMELVFMHVLHILKAAQWSDSYFEEYVEKEEKLCKTKFEKFIADIYRNMNVDPGKHSFVTIQGISADLTIMAYCEKNPDIDYICMSTRGAGKFKKIFGTNTGNLITKSNVPVLAVPGKYRVAPVKSILYAADFLNYSEELKKVVDFALPFKAKIAVLHFTWPYEIILDEKTVEATLKKEYKYNLEICFEKNDADHSLIENLQKQISVRKPSVVAMFTNQERTLFQKIFLSSKTEELSFELTTPLLVFKKIKTVQ